MSIFIQEVLGLLNRNQKKITLDKTKDWFEFGKLYQSSSLNNKSAYTPKMDPFVIKWGDLVCQATQDLTRTLPGEGKFGYIPVYTDPSGTCSWDTLKDSLITQNTLNTIINVAANLQVNGNVQISGGNLTATTSTFNLLNTAPVAYINFGSTTTNIEIGGSATVVNINGTTQSTSCTTGALVIDGGVGIAKNLNICGTISMTKAEAEQAILISGNNAINGLINVSANDGVCIKAYANDGTTIIAGSLDGTAINATSNDGASIRTSSTGVGGLALFVDGSARGITVNNGGIKIQGSVHDDTTYQLALTANSAAKPSTNTWTIASDERVKTNINPYTKGLETILAINPITYDYNGKAGFDLSSTGNIGIIAQDVLDIIPESINTFHTLLNEDDKEKTELYNFDSHALTFILINAIKELNAKIKLLESK